MGVRHWWLGLVLPAALAGSLSSQETPAVAADPHDTIAAPPDTAGPPPELSPPGAASTGFAVKFKDEVSPYPVMGLFVMPGDTVPLEAVLTDTLSRYTAEAGTGRLERTGPARWRWIAPERRECPRSWCGIRRRARRSHSTPSSWSPGLRGRRSMASVSGGTSRVRYAGIPDTRGRAGWWR